MSLYRLNPDDFGYFSLKAHPRKTYVSSSVDGANGTAYVYARRSNILKDVLDTNILTDTYDDGSAENIRMEAASKGPGVTDIESIMESYLDSVRSQTVAARLNSKREIHRFVPPYEFNFEYGAKNLIRNHLMPYYRVEYPSANYNFTNYNCLNFHSDPDFPDDAVLLYPNPISGTQGSEYQLSGAFAFDFWIKPKYTVDEGEDYKAGSLLHLSGAYCISVHTGSSVDQNGKPDAFRISLQLGEDADVPPSLLDPDNPSNNGGFTLSTLDNALPIGEWTHVTFTWRGYDSASLYGSGSIFLNGKESSKFNINSDLSLGTYEAGNEPSVLCVGNYYVGDNQGNNSLNRFFGNDTSEREGLYELNSSAGFFAPDVYNFSHPLNAEVHDIKIYNRHIPLQESVYLAENGPSETLGLRGLRFYLPPFFTEESPFRKNYGGMGGVMVSPFYAKDQSTTTPFANEMAFSCGGIYINLENYTRDFATGNYPRLWSLTGSAHVPPSSTELSANDFLFAEASNRKRQGLILPSDNGNFSPNFDLLKELGQSRFKNDLGNPEWGVISLNEIVSESQYRSSKAMLAASGSILNDVLGASDTDITARPASSLAIAHRTQDNSSNFVVIFDISNLYYGARIKPKSLTLRDSSLKYTGGRFTIKDDGNGNLYRADANGHHPTWASLGNVFYDEGLIILKSPSLYFFGEEQFEIEFQGTQTIHVLSISATAQPMTQVSSSNPSFIPQPADDLTNNDDKDFVYITGINVHDDNLNVISRTNLAQPVVKRTGDKILFRIRMDY